MDTKEVKEKIRKAESDIDDILSKLAEETDSSFNSVSVDLIDSTRFSDNAHRIRMAMTRISMRIGD